MKTSAPLGARVLAQLRADAQNIRATAKRKGLVLGSLWEEREEMDAAKEHFDLGCWLFYYSRLVGLEDGFNHRIDCARRLLLAGINNPGYKFHTVFEFGEREFDTIFEMGDGGQVVAGLEQLARQDRTGFIREGMRDLGLKPSQLAIF